MKINRTTDPLTEPLAQNSQTTNNSQSSAGQAASTAATAKIGYANLSTTDSVNVSLGRYLNSVLDPQQIAAERKQKFDDIKKRYDAGQYHVSSDKIASAFAQDVSFEILGGSGSGTSDLFEDK